jgi:outer membrane protein OmpA-like peptidoglycan-associated protein
VVIPAEGYPSKPSVTPSDIVMPLSVPRKPPAPPFERSTFHLVFDFADDRLVYQSADVVLERAALFALTSQAKLVEVQGHADVQGVVASGQLLRESLPLARARAEAAAEALRRLGVPPASLKLRWSADAPALPEAGAMGGPSKRRVTIVVTP